MTEKQERKAARFFGEGVQAAIWTYSRDWCIRVDRGEDGSITFLRLDELKRVLQTKNLEFCRGDSYVEFHSEADLRACVVEMQKALDYIRSVSDNADWRELPAELVKIREGIEPISGMPESASPNTEADG